MSGAATLRPRPRHLLGAQHVPAPWLPVAQHPQTLSETKKAHAQVLLRKGACTSRLGPCRDEAQRGPADAMCQGGGATGPGARGRAPRGWQGRKQGTRAHGAHGETSTAPSFPPGAGPGPSLLQVTFLTKATQAWKPAGRPRQGPSKLTSPDRLLPLPFQGSRPTCVSRLSPRPSLAWAEAARGSEQSNCPTPAPCPAAEPEGRGTTQPAGPTGHTQAQPSSPEEPALCTALSSNTNTDAQHGSSVRRSPEICRSFGDLGEAVHNPGPGGSPEAGNGLHPSSEPLQDPCLAPEP